MKNILPIVLLVGLIIALVVSGLLWLDHMGVVNFKGNVYPKLATLPLVGRFFTPPAYVWEDFRKEELRKLNDSIVLKLEEFKVKEEELKEREENLVKREEGFVQREEDFMNKTWALEERMAQYEDEEKKLGKLVSYYENMNPDAAAKILAEMDDLDAIEILRRMRDETVAVIFMNMYPKRAGELSRKMMMIK